MSGLADVVYTAYQGALVTWALDGTNSIGTWVERHVNAVLSPYRRTSARRDAP